MFISCLVLERELALVERHSSTAIALQLRCSMPGNHLLRRVAGFVSLLKQLESCPAQALTFAQEKTPAGGLT